MTDPTGPTGGVEDAPTAAVPAQSRADDDAARLRIAFSPCPNDTFVFHAWVHGLVPGLPAPEVTFADIDVTNGMAEREEGDVLKVSYAVLPWVLERYALLPCGGALGRGCGPLVLTRDPGGGPQRLAGGTVAVPSDRSTAYLLFRLWAARHVPGGVGEVRVMPFHEIMPAVRDGLVDAGLVIHEARFTFHRYGLHRLADLGEFWEGTTGHPIPLGAIIAKRSLGEERLRGIAEESRTVVVATHDVEFAAVVADRVLLMAEGEVVADGAAHEVLTSTPLLAPQVATVLPGSGALTVADVAERLAEVAP